MKYILASASPRRKELLSLFTEDFEIVPSNVPEIVPNDLEVEKHSEYLAKLKADDIAKQYSDFIVIGADTSVIASVRQTYSREKQLKLSYYANKYLK